MDLVDFSFWMFKLPKSMIVYYTVYTCLLDHDGGTCVENIDRGIAGLEQSGGVCKVAFSFLAKESVEAHRPPFWGRKSLGKIGRNLIEGME